MQAYVKKRLAFLTMSILALCLLVVCGGCGGKKQAQQNDKANKPKETVTLRLAAAASLEKVFVQQLLPGFAAKHPEVKVEASYDASGRLQKQIEQGFKADVFISASPKQMQALVTKDYIKKEAVQPLLENKLVLIVPKNSQGKLKGFRDFSLAKHPAVGDPKSVPAGQYAKEALTSLGLWTAVEPRLSLGTNVVQVLNWVAEGSADAGMVYASDAATNKRVLVVEEAPLGSLKKKVLYPVSVLQRTEQERLAKEFVAYLFSTEAAKAFQEYGFTVAK